MTPVSGNSPIPYDHRTPPQSGSTVERHLVWVCAGCERCQEPSTDGVTPGASIPHDTPCTDTSPSMNGMVVVAAADYDRLAWWVEANVPGAQVMPGGLVVT